MPDLPVLLARDEGRVFFFRDILLDNHVRVFRTDSHDCKLRWDPFIRFIRTILSRFFLNIKNILYIDMIRVTYFFLSFFAVVAQKSHIIIVNTEFALLLRRQESLCLNEFVRCANLTENIVPLKSTNQVTTTADRRSKRNL